MLNILNTLSSLTGALVNKVQAGQIFDQALAHFQAKEYKAALPLMKEAAEKGSPYAMAHLGIMAMKGQGMPCDWKKAAELMEMTIRLENYQGTHFSTTTLKSNIGMIYAIGGYGLKRDFGKAKAFLQEAIDEGDGRSVDFLKLVMARKGIFGQKEKAKPDIKW